MKGGALPRGLLLLVLSGSVLQGCAELSTLFIRTSPVEKPPAVAPEGPALPAPSEAPAPPAVPAPPAAPTPPAAPAPPAAKPPTVSAADRLFAEGMSTLQEGGHVRALELFSAAWQEKQGHAGVAREFDGALLALKKSGDAAYAQGKWEEAGKRWMATLRFITHPAANPADYPFTRGEVRAKVDRLSASLTEKALTEYRRGEIPAAIAEWRTILSYDPGHEEAARSLQTALKQIETLKKMPPGK